jgi:hypothetical protein
MLSEESKFTHSIGRRPCFFFEVFEVFAVQFSQSLSGAFSSHHAHVPGGRAAPIPEIIHFPIDQNLKIPEPFPQGPGRRGMDPRGKWIFSTLDDMLEDYIPARTERVFQAR